MLLAATDAALAAFGLIISTLITVVGGMVMRRQDHLGKQIGTANGHGPVNDSLSQLHHRIDGIEGRLDDQESKREAGSARMERIESSIDIAETRREAGAHRMERIQLGIERLEMQIAAHASWQETHTVEDVASFQSLKQAIDELRALLGTAREGDDPQPVIPYVHDAVHDLRNQIASSELAMRALLQEAIHTLEQARNQQEEP